MWDVRYFSFANKVQFRKKSNACQVFPAILTIFQEQFPANKLVKTTKNSIIVTEI